MGWFRNLFGGEIHHHVHVSGEVKLSGEKLQLVILRSEEQNDKAVVSVGGSGSSVKQGRGEGGVIEIITDDDRLQDLGKKISGQGLPKVIFGKEEETK